jgi:hypothetical protein
LARFFALASQLAEIARTSAAPAKDTAATIPTVDVDDALLNAFHPVPKNREYNKASRALMSRNFARAEEAA